MDKFREKDVEDVIVSYLQKNNYEFINKENNNWFKSRLDGVHNPYINVDLLLETMKKFNKYDNTVLQDAVNELIRIDDNSSLFEKNFTFHQMLINGITIERKNVKSNPLVKFINFENIENNIFQVARQVEYRGLKQLRIPDVVVFINGIPLIVMELKSFSEDATEASIEKAYEQIGGNTENDGYRYDIPTLFTYNAFLVISNAVDTRVGTLTSTFDRFSEWKSINGEKGYAESSADLSVLINGLFNHQRLLDLIENNLFFIKDKNDKPIKIMAQYHQYFGAQKAMQSVLEHLKPSGDGKAGLLWHTQGSGKSYTMVMLAHKLIKCKKQLQVPTIVVLTDRIDLDNQLYKTFYSAKDYLGCEPVVAKGRKDLVKKLNGLKQGGIILSIINKFDKDNLPSNNRNNIIVMTDEAHRSHYGIYEQAYYVKNKETDEYEAVFKYGIEKYIRESLPNATYIGFTGTPISTKEKQTTDVFGNIIDVYDMSQSILDKSTVKLFYESRLSRVYTNDKMLSQIDDYYKNLEVKELANKNAIEKSKTQMSKFNVILEDDDLIERFAQDIWKHYEDRSKFLNGKAMIACQTRKMAAKLYNKMLELKPDFKDKLILVATTTNKDTKEVRDLFGDDEHRRALANEFKKDTSKYKIAIVVDMWLTGFDVPDLDTMYFIKRLKAHNLMQAIARVNRVYTGKSSGLIVDYIGLNKALDEALSEYTDKDRNNNVLDVKKAIQGILLDKLEELSKWFDIKDRNIFRTSKDSASRFEAIERGTQKAISSQKDEDKFMQISLAIKQAFVVCNSLVNDEQKSDINYYLAIRSYLLKLRNKNNSVSTKDMNEYVSKLLRDAIKGDEVKVLTKNPEDTTNVFELLSTEKIEEYRNSHPPLIFIEIMKKLSHAAIQEFKNSNYFKAQEYSYKLRKILEQYNSRDTSFDSHKTIVNLVEFAHEMVANENKAQKLGIKGRERAFYDSLIQEKDAALIMKDQILKAMACELSTILEKIAKESPDWYERDASVSEMRIAIRECLIKYKYPPNYRENTIINILKQAEYSFR